MIIGVSDDLLVMTVRVRGNPATLAARVPVIAANVDARLFGSRWTNGSGGGITL